jgi:hypothetical protein
MTLARHRLDDLLARLPATVPEPPPRTVTSSSVSDSHWERLLRTTLERVEGERSGKPAPETKTSTRFDIDDVLRTPLPVAADEPNDGAFQEPEGRNGFDDLFANESDDFDPLRAPLKSGEHLPVAAIAAQTPAVTPESPALRAEGPRRPSLLLFWGGAGTLAAAAALVLALRPAQLPPSVSSTEIASANHVTATHQPTPARAGAGQGLANPAEEQVQARALANAAMNAATNAASEVAPGETRVSAGKPVIAGSGSAIRATKAAAAPAHEAPASREPPLEPAAGPSSAEDHPSTGAISAALLGPGKVARACVSPGGKRVNVTVAFGSAGNVVRVGVGKASLTPAEHQCIVAAFSSATVGPFARKQYEVNYPLIIP